MNITVTVDDVTLDALVHEGYDGDGWTVGQEIARQALKKLTADRDGSWDSVRSRVDRIKDEEIREAIRPLITEALTKPFRPTNSYNEPTGPETTLSALIMDAARKASSTKADSYGNGQTVLQKLVADEVAKAFRNEIADEVKKARAMVAEQIGQQVAAAVSAGMRAR